MDHDGNMIAQLGRPRPQATQRLTFQEAWQAIRQFITRPENMDNVSLSNLAVAQIGVSRHIVETCSWRKPTAKDEGTEVLLYHPHFLCEDFNPTGTVTATIYPGKMFVAAVWNDAQDCYISFEFHTLWDDDLWVCVPFIPPIP